MNVEEILNGGPLDGDVIMVDPTTDVICFPDGNDGDGVHVYAREEYVGFVYRGPDELILVKAANP